jgi:hypothetical protein
MSRNINQPRYDLTDGQESRQVGCTHAFSPIRFWATGLPALKTFIAMECVVWDGENA